LSRRIWSALVWSRRAGDRGPTSGPTPVEIPAALQATLDASEGVQDAARLLGADGRAPHRRDRERRGVLRRARPLARLAGPPRRGGRARPRGG
jgi:hypothetical protein